MYTGQPYGVAKLCLRQWKVEISIIPRFTGGEPPVELTKQMRDAVAGVTTAYIYEPFMQKRRINQSVCPKGSPDCRPLKRHLPNGIAAHLDSLHRRKRLNVVVRRFQKKLVAID
jgi:hypothetical protein